MLLAPFVKFFQTEDTEFDRVKVRIFTPVSMLNKENRPAILHYHGGGWCVSTVGQYEGQLTTLSDKGWAADRCDKKVMRN